MKQLRIAIRVDASLNIGSGHLIRCLTLASELRSRGVEVEFITREHPGNLVATIVARGFQCHILPFHPSRPCNDSGHAAWLESSQEDDCNATKAILSRRGAVDCMIVDHYAINAPWETSMRAHARHIMVIDDLADRVHDCDLLLDQNLYANIAARYRALLPSSCEQLLGPEFALLSQDFSQRRALAFARKIKAPFRLLVFFGGVDASDETGKFLQAWGSSTRTVMTADVIIGASNLKAQTLASKASAIAGIRVHRSVSNMAEIMLHADYSFGASGATTWERFCMGLNGTIVSVAQNQLELVAHLTAIDLIEYLGDRQHTSPSAYEHALADLDPSSEKLILRRKQIMERVDGNGTSRVVQRILQRLTPTIPN